MFATEMQSRLNRKAINVDDICFTDECYVGTGPSSNRQNDGYWRLTGDSRPEDHLKQREFQGDRTHIFIAVHAKAGVIGPIYVDELDCPEDSTHTTLTAKRYAFMLRTIVIPELRSRLSPGDFEKCWYQHDGAAPHTAAISREYLREVFQGRLISLRENLIWPPYSPDLSPLDYWFWFLMRKKIGQDLPRTRDEIKLCASRACSEISVEETKKAIRDFPIRIRALLQYGGAHFEHSLAKFKRDLNRLEKICGLCNMVHCDCPRCQNSCQMIHDSEEELAFLPDALEFDVIDQDVGAFEELGDSS